MEKGKPKYGTLSNVAFMIKEAWHSWKQILVLCLLYGLFDLMVTVVQMYVSPSILAKVQQGVSARELILTILLFAGLLFLASAGKAYTDDTGLFGRMALRTGFINQMEEKYASTSYPNIEDPVFYELFSKAKDCVSDNRASTEAFWETLGWLIRDALGLIIYVVLLSRLPMVLIIVVVATTVLSFLVTRYVSSWEYRHREEESKLSKKAGYIREKPADIALGKDIRIFGMQNWLEDIYSKVIYAYEAFHEKKQRYLLVGNFVDVIMAMLRNGIAYYILIRMAIQGTISIPAFLLYFAAFSGLTTWVSGVMNDVLTLHRQCLDLSILRECLEYPESFQIYGGDAVNFENTAYELTMDHVSFRYPGNDAETLSEIDLTIHPGEKVAVVGLNGAGKTTLVKLLCGFEDPTEGRILLNGKDIRSFNRQQYYRLFTAVFQNFTTINATIEENVAMRVDEVDKIRVEKSLANTDLLDKVKGLPQREKTHIGKEVYEDGIELSGGEMQRLMLARALYRNAPILVLDEPTAALDPIAEDHIYHQYHAMSGGRTSIFISHRLASTRFCDRILMLENGKIAEEGTHEQLIKKKGPYAQLFEIQSRYYKEEVPENEEGN